MSEPCSVEQFVRALDGWPDPRTLPTTIQGYTGCFFDRRVHPDGRVLEIYQDENPPNPREDQSACLGHMICCHHRFKIGDKHDYQIGDYAGWPELRERLEQDFAPDPIILPLYLYDHSQLHLSVTPFDCAWDSGPVGFLVASKAEMEGIRYPEAALVAVVAEYNAYLSGDCYEYFLLSPKGELLDDLQGLYGLEAVKDHVPGYARFKRIEVIEPHLPKRR